MFSYLKIRALKHILSYLVILITFLSLPLSALASNPIQSYHFMNSSNTLIVQINLLSFNAAIGDIDTRLEMLVPNKLISSSYSPKSDIYLIDLFSVGDSVFKLSSEKRFSIYDAVLSSKYQVHDAGTQFLYPFDVHHTKIAFFSEMKLANDPLLPPIFKRIPLHYDCSLCSFEGFDVKVSHANDFAQDFVSLNLAIHRSSAVVIFALCTTVAMWVVAAAVIILTRRIVKNKAPPNMAALGFIGSLLFALPAVRYIQPMVPPMGILIDYLGFFWVEFLVIISLMIMVICWAHRTKLGGVKAEDSMHH
jgi:hypothetical protein